MCLDTIMNLINMICQVIMTITAIVAIIIAVKQIRGKKKSDLKVSYHCGVGLANTKEGKMNIIAGVNIELRNLGYGPIYYDYCGFVFVNDKKISKKKNYPGIITDSTVNLDMKTLLPGTSTNESFNNVDDLLGVVNEDKRLSDSDKVYIFVSLCSGKQLYYYTGDSYKAFVEKYCEIKKSRGQGE